MVFPQKGNKKWAKRNRQTKQTLVFDESARKDYLTGFRKRKDERRRHYVEKMERDAKEEKKRLKQQVREMVQARLKHQPIVPEIQHLLDPQVYDLPSHTVTVTDISEIDLSGKDGLRLGQNVFHESEDKTEEVTDKRTTTPAGETAHISKPKSAEEIAEDPKKKKVPTGKLQKVGQGKVKKLKMNQKKSRKKKKNKRSSNTRGRKKK